MWLLDYRMGDVNNQWLQHHARHHDTRYRYIPLPWNYLECSFRNRRCRVLYLRSSNISIYHWLIRHMTRIHRPWPCHCSSFSTSIVIKTLHMTYLTINVHCIQNVTVITDIECIGILRHRYNSMNSQICVMMTCTPVRACLPLPPPSTGLIVFLHSPLLASNTRTLPSELPLTI